MSKMTESKSPSSNRIPCPGVLATPTGLAHIYLGSPLTSGMQQRPKTNQDLSSSTSTVTCAAITTTAEAANIKVSIAAMKDLQLIATDHSASSCIGYSTIKAFPTFATAEKLHPMNSLRDSHSKVNSKSLEIQKVSYLKQVAASSVKTIVSTDHPISVQAPLTKDSKPFLVGAGLRPPLKSQQHLIGKANPDHLKIRPRISCSRASSWAGTQQTELIKSNLNPISALVRSKATFPQASVPATSPHNYSRKDSVQILSRSIAITSTVSMPTNEPSYHMTAFSVAGLSAGFVSSNDVPSTGHVIIKTSVNTSFVQNSTHNGLNISSIPVAKVYPQQIVTSTATLTVPSVTPNQMHVAVVSTVGASITKAPTSLVQVGALMSTSSIVVTKPVTMSALPIAIARPSNSACVESVLCWSQTLPVSTVTSSQGSRQSLTLSGAQHIGLPGTVRVQPQSVLLVEPKSAHLQAPLDTCQPQDVKLNISPSPSQGVLVSCPNQSPKPTILRRQRPENNNALKKLTFSGAISSTSRKDLRPLVIDRRNNPYSIGMHSLPGHGEREPDIPVLIQSEKSCASSNLENADSASRMLLLQNQSMHSYAADSHSTNAKHQLVSQESGHHVTTNTIFTKSVSKHPSQNYSNQKPLHLSKVSGVASVISSSTSCVEMPSKTVRVDSVLMHGLADASSNKEGTMLHGHIKIEPPTIKVISEIEDKPDSCHHLSQTVSNHFFSSPTKSYGNFITGAFSGFSPRKRPRKQTHVVSDQPVILEDEESTDDADECEDEPVIKESSFHHHYPVSTSVSSKVYGTSSSNFTVKTESSNTIGKSEEPQSKKAKIKTEPDAAPSNCKATSEFFDQNGVRYVLNRKRPAVSVLNRAKQSTRATANHFMHYSDVRAKGKKTTIADLALEKSRLNGFNVARLSLQLEDMVSYEKDVWNRIKIVYDGLVRYKYAHLSDESFDSLLNSPMSLSPSVMSSSSLKVAADGNSSIVMPENAASLVLHSKKTDKVKDDILFIEELAQANLQRCQVVTDQLSDTKAMLLKVMEHRQMVTEILDSTLDSRTYSSNISSNQNSKRLKKKYSS